ncbi:MAG: four helix bundle protein [Alphaproteobacteria bacterium]|nr:four helix bundle protein [Alphaproteobacteria bacterium]
MAIRSYEDLTVWQKAMDLVERIYHTTESFPKKEQYRLVDQLSRAAVSVPSNIAEGSMRHTTKEFIRFVSVSQGSLAEVETQLIIAYRLRYIDKDNFSSTIGLAREVGKMLNALNQALEKKLQGITSHQH